MKIKHILVYFLMLVLIASVFATQIFAKWDKPKCKDSDGGKNYYIKGITKGIAWGTSKHVKKTDHCITEGPKAGRLAEYFCNRGKVASISYDCPNGCEEGACVPDFRTDGSDKIELKVKLVNGIARFNVLLGNGTQFIHFGEDYDQLLQTSCTPNCILNENYQYFIASANNETHILEVTRVDDDDGITVKDIFGNTIVSDFDDRGDTFYIGDVSITLNDYNERRPSEDFVNITVLNGVNYIYTTDGREILLTSAGELPSEKYEIVINEPDGSKTVYYFGWKDEEVVIENIVS